jgi:hypothetical protein
MRLWTRVWTGLVLGGVLGCPAALGQANWVQLFPTSAPPSRAYGAMVYDAKHQQMVLFGGSLDGDYVGDTWVWDGTTWTQKSPATSPPARELHAMVYDSVNQQVVLFGGYDNVVGYRNDTWIWDGTTWTQMFPAMSPPVQGFHSMAYDKARQQVVIGGGIGPSGSGIINDTWVWDGINWTQKTPATNPPEGFDQAVLTYDEARQLTVRFTFVYDSTTRKYLPETWTWDGVNWTQQAPAGTPVARNLSSFMYFAATQQSVLFGGAILNSSSFLADTWTWDGTNWTLIPPANSPSPRDGAMIAYDTVRQQAVLFGGFNSPPDNYLGDTWLFSEGSATTFGHIDTPVDHSTGVAGGVAVTGWALSSAGIQSVGIWREPVLGEVPTSNGLVFLLDATIVPGSRPDVA